MEGPVTELKPEDYQDIYDREPLFCKVRSHVCNQGQPVSWEEQKEKHDQIFQENKDGKNSLPMPEHL